MSWLILFGGLLFANFISYFVTKKQQTQFKRDKLIADCERIRKQEELLGSKIQNNYHCEDLKEEDIERWRIKRNIKNKKLKENGYNGELD